MKRSYEHTDEDNSRQAGPSSLSANLNNLDLSGRFTDRSAHPSSTPLDPDAQPFRPHEIPPRPIGPQLSLSLPELPEADEWMMVDLTLGRPLLGWTEAYYIDRCAVEGIVSRYVVGVSAFEVIVGSLDVDAFPGHLNPLMGVLEWVYRKFRPCGDIVSAFCRTWC